MPLYYKGNSYSGVFPGMTDAIGLGYSSCGAALPGKLSVDQTYASGNVNLETNAGYFHNGDVTTSATNNFSKRGIYGISEGIGHYASPPASPSFFANIGGDFLALNCDMFNIGVHGKANTERMDYNFGGWFQGYGAQYGNIGVNGYTDNSASFFNYGVYGETKLGTCGNSIPLSSCIDAAGAFNGDLFTTDNSYSGSDIALKDNIEPIENALDVIEVLNPVSYTFKTAQFPFINLSDRIQHGLIAQEVQTILPELVKMFVIPPKQDGLGNLDTTSLEHPFLALNYTGLIPYLIQGIKEQQNIIDSLIITDSITNERLDAIERIMQTCCQNGSARQANPAIAVQLSNSIILNQNDPNPFAEETNITYNVPGSVADAKIIFFDNSGHILQTVKINERGSGQLIVYASNLTSGIYSYSLIADGKVIDTKKMVCTK